MELIDSQDPTIQRMRRVRRQNRNASVAASGTLLLLGGGGLVLVFSHFDSLPRVLTYGLGAGAIAISAGVYKLLASTESPFDED